MALLWTVAVTPLDAQHREAPPWPVLELTGTLLTAVFLDDLAREHLGGPQGPGADRLSHVGNVLGRGRWVALGLVGAAGTGRLTGVPGLAHTAEHTLLALGTAGAVNGALKVGVGRRRPDADSDGDGRFRPFSLDDRWQSFPSGHVVTAFTVAAALSEEARTPWVTGTTHALAAVVGWSRIHEHRHWASDVVAGAAIGTLAGRWTVRRLHRGDASDAGDPDHLPSTARQTGTRILAVPSGVLVIVPVR
jgi:membrane-associated phospholipid phosphatase